MVFLCYSRFDPCTSLSYRQACTLQTDPSTYWGGVSKRNTFGAYRLAVLDYPNHRNNNHTQKQNVSPQLPPQIMGRRWLLHALITFSCWQAIRPSRLNKGHILQNNFSSFFFLLPVMKALLFLNTCLSDVRDKKYELDFASFLCRFCYLTNAAQTCWWPEHFRILLFSPRGI